MKQLLLLFLIGAPILSSYSQAFQVGEKIPDIVAEGINGEEISLSSLQGKIVLVDFWAGWCAPCRKENHFIVDTYLKYKEVSFKSGEGFTVFSVSLDGNKNMWKSIVKKDSLIWPYHVIEPLGFDGPISKQYAITSIPQSYLIDGQGKIIAVNLRGDDLETKLKRIKNKNFFF